MSGLDRRYIEAHPGLASGDVAGAPDHPVPAPTCPECGRVMSWREKREQGACNDCHGGAWSPDPFYPRGTDW